MKTEHQARRLGGGRPRMWLRMAAASALAVGASGSALAFITLANDENSPGLFWAEAVGQPIDYTINANGSDDIPDGSDDTAIRLGFLQWEQVPTSFIRFVEDTTPANKAIATPNTPVHSIIFDENNSTSFFPAGSSVIAITPLTFQINSGAITDADIIFNGAQRFSTTQAVATFDVQTIVTHEIGHFIGLDHEPSFRSTMFQSASFGTVHQRSLSTDDAAGAGSIYPNAAYTTGTGSIAGTVTMGGNAVRAAHVVATDRATGVTAVTTITAPNGAYTIGGLAPGSYDLHVEPLDAPTSQASISRVTAADTAFTTAELANVSVSAGGTSMGNGVTVTDANADGAGNRLDVSGTVPSQRVRGTAAFTLSILGNDFDAGGTVSITGGDLTLRNVQVLGDSQINVRVTVPADATVGVRSIRVTNSEGEVAYLTGGFEVLDPAPTVGSVAPSTASVDAGAVVTVNGTGFQSPASVIFGGELATGVSVDSPTQITATLPAAPAPGQQDVVVINPDGQQGILQNGIARFVDPIITAVSPGTASTQGGSVLLVIGNNFLAGATVTVGGSAATVTDLTPTRITITAPANPAGAADVTVTNPDDRSDTLADAVTYIDEAPILVNAVVPSSGPQTGGTRVSVQGSGFDMGATVAFDGVPGANPQVVSDGEIMVTTPAGAPGPADVIVTNPSGQSGIGPSAFNYDAVFVGGGGGGGGGGCGALPVATIGEARGAAGALGPLGLVVAFLLSLTMLRRRPM